MATTPSNNTELKIDTIDIARLVGFEIRVFPEQSPVNPIKVRVVSAHDQQITVEAGGHSVVFDNLVNKQNVTLQFPYRGQGISVHASLRRGSGGRCSFLLDNKVVPLMQRRFLRLDLRQALRFAPFPIASHSRRSLTSLRWVETETRNISSGGVLVETPGLLEHDTHLLVNIDWEHDLLPSLLLGRVRHCHADGNNHYCVGIEFLVREAARSVIPYATSRGLPRSVFEYTERRRERLNRKVTVWNPEKENRLKDRS